METCKGNGFYGQTEVHCHLDWDLLDWDQLDWGHWTGKLFRLRSFGLKNHLDW